MHLCCTACLPEAHHQCMLTAVSLPRALFNKSPSLSWSGSCYLQKPSMPSKRDRPDTAAVVTVLGLWCWALACCLLVYCVFGCLSLMKKLCVQDKPSSSPIDLTGDSPATVKPPKPKVCTAYPLPTPCSPSAHICCMTAGPGNYCAALVPTFAALCGGLSCPAAVQEGPGQPIPPKGCCSPALQRYGREAISLSQARACTQCAWSCAVSAAGQLPPDHAVFPRLLLWF